MLSSQLVVAPNGRVVIPAAMRSALNIQSGGKILARVVDGAIILEPVDTAVRRAQAMVSRYVADGETLVDQLISERHEAALRE